jgi:hypothetical protein
MTISNAYFASYRVTEEELSRIPLRDVQEAARARVFRELANTAFAVDATEFWVRTSTVRSHDDFGLGLEYRVEVRPLR